MAKDNILKVASIMMDAFCFVLDCYRKRGSQFMQSTRFIRKSIIKIKRKYTQILQGFFIET